jgi:DNA polymerase-1
VLRYRQFKKLKATYVDYLASHYDADQRIHGSYNQTVTDTNRFSSSDPNLQNIPNRSAIGKSIRKAFVARPGYKLIRTDASNLEVRVWAHWTDDDVLRQVFVAGGTPTELMPCACSARTRRSSASR